MSMTAMTIHRKFWLRTVALVALTPTVSGTHIVGNLEVDATTLPRMASAADVLVRLTEAETPYTHSEDSHFMDLANRFVVASGKIRDDFLVATVVVQSDMDDIDYESEGEPDNHDVAGALGGSGEFEDYPEYFFLKKGTKDLSKAKKFEGSEKTADAIAAFVLAEAGVLLGGETLKEMDDIAEQFIKADGDAERQNELVAEAEKVADSYSNNDDKETSGVYLKLMAKARENGMSYFTTETKRVTNMLVDGKMSQTKWTSFFNKLTVLGSFTNPGDEL